MDMVEVARFHDLHEADLAASFLMAHGVTASVADRHLATIDPLMWRALGGLRVMTPHDQADRARDLLTRAEGGEFAEVAAEPKVEPRRGGLGLAMLVGLGGLVFPAAGLAATAARRRSNPVLIIGLICAVAMILVALALSLG